MDGQALLAGDEVTVGKFYLSSGGEDDSTVAWHAVGGGMTKHWLSLAGLDLLPYCENTSSPQPPLSYSPVISVLLSLLSLLSLSAFYAVCACCW